MENKVYKNKNMIRTKHNVTRIVECGSKEEAERFKALYEDKFDRCNIGEPSEYYNHGYRVVGMIRKSDFDDIVHAIGLTKVKGTNKNKYWKTETAQV